MHVESVTQPGREWDEFAERREKPSLGHAWAWGRILGESYGLSAYHLIARDVEGRVAGLLPLARVRTWRGRSELVSLPFLDSAGSLAADAAAETALCARALALARELGVHALELRREAASHRPALEGPGPRVDLVLPLEPDELQQWKVLGAKVRNQTRKAEREGLVVAEAHEEGLLDAFYRVYCENMRDLGSPAHARGFFAAIERAFGPRVRFVVTRLGSRPVGGLVAIHFGRRVTVPWASILRAERARCPNNQIYWEAIRWAITLGAREFDFGRSPRGAGTHRFKLGWGARERELPWVRLAPTGEVLDHVPDAESPVLRGISAAWQQLPVPVATFLGARLRRFLPA